MVFSMIHRTPTRTQHARKQFTRTPTGTRTLFARTPTGTPTRTLFTRTPTGSSITGRWPTAWFTGTSPTNNNPLTKQQQRIRTFHTPSRDNHEKIRRDLIDEVQQKGHAISPDKVVHIGRDPRGIIVWLEEGNERAGLQHILNEQRVSEFERAGIPRDDIGKTVFRAVTEGRLIGTVGRDRPRPVYEVEYNGGTRKIAVTVGNNGFIVGANPVSSKRIKPLSVTERMRSARR